MENKANLESLVKDSLLPLGNSSELLDFGEDRYNFEFPSCGSTLYPTHFPSLEIFSTADRLPTIIY